MERVFMRFGRFSAITVLAAGLVLGTAGVAGATTPVTPVTTSPQASLSFTSQAGDYVGQGQSMSFTDGTAGSTVTVSRRGDGIQVSQQQFANGALVQNWTLIAAMPTGQAWTTGSFVSTRMGSPTTAGIDFGGDGRGCNQSFGTMTVNAIRLRADGSVATLDLAFSQNCEQTTAPVLTGHVTYADLSNPDLNYLAFDGAAGETVSQGQAGYYAPGSDATTTTTFQVQGRGSQAEVSVYQYAGTTLVHNWSLSAAMPGGQTWQTGTFASTRSPSTTTAGIDFSGDGRGCNQSFGTMTVNAVRLHADGTIAKLDIWFQQQCEQTTAPMLTGHVVFNDHSSNYTFSSDPTNKLGMGQSGTYWGADSDIVGTYDGRNVWASVAAPNDTWTIELTPPRTANFVPGTAYTVGGSAHDNVGAIHVTRNGVACTQPSGTLNMRALTISGSTVTSLSASFLIVCDGSSGGLSGSIRINA
jgi:hypothetical protein